MFRKLRNRVRNMNGLFHGHYVGAGPLYVELFKQVPNVLFIPELDTAKVLRHIYDRYKADVLDIYQHQYFEHKEKQVYFNNTIILFKERKLVELTDVFIQILFANVNDEWVDKLTREVVEYRIEPVPAKENRIIGFARHNDAN